MAAAARAGGALAERLQARREEIEQAVLTRVYAISDPTELGDPEYVAGLRGAVRTALEYALAVLEGEEPRPESIPPALIAQARLAARGGASLDTVLRRYFAGYTSLCDYLLQEVEGDGALGASLQRALRAMATLFDQIVSAVTDAYKHEVQHRRRTIEHRRVERVKALLAGEPVDAAELDYDLDLWHLGVLAVGPDAPRLLRALAAKADRRLLLVQPGGEAVWGWLGGRRKMAADQLTAQIGAERFEVLLAIGEPGRGVAGWRLTHRQAEAALPVAIRGERPIVHYSEVALVASVLQDEVLTGSLSELYLAPLATERDGGTALRQTLRAYFAAGRNVASAAAALGVSRQTVNSRLHTIEERIGARLNTCGTEVETALRLRDLNSA